MQRKIGKTGALVTFLKLLYHHSSRYAAGHLEKPPLLKCPEAGTFQIDSGPLEYLEKPPPLDISEAGTFPNGFWT